MYIRVNLWLNDRNVVLKISVMQTYPTSQRIYTITYIVRTITAMMYASHHMCKTLSSIIIMSIIIAQYVALYMDGYFMFITANYAAPTKAPTDNTLVPCIKRITHNMCIVHDQRPYYIIMYSLQCVI